MDYDSFIGMPMLDDFSVKTDESWKTSSAPPIGLTITSQPAKMFLYDDEDQAQESPSCLSHPPMFDWSTTHIETSAHESSQPLLTLPPAVAPPLPSLPEGFTTNLTDLKISVGGGDKNKIIQLQDFTPIAPPNIQPSNKRKRMSAIATDSQPKRKRTGSASLTIKKEQLQDDDTTSVGSGKPVTGTAKRKRHNEVEIRRRKKIAQSFNQLRELTQCSRSNKGAVLSSAIEAVTHLRDQVEQLEAELKQERHAAKLCVLDGAAVPVVVCKLDGRILECNDSFANMLRRPRSELIKVGHMFQIASPDTLPDFFGAMKHLLNGSNQSVDVYQVLGGANGIAVRMTAWLSSDKSNPTARYMHCTVLPVHSHSSFGRVFQSQPADSVSSSDSTTRSVQSSSPRVMDESS